MILPVNPGECRSKIGFVVSSYPPESGGVANAARRLVGYLVEAGFSVHVVTYVEAPGAGAPVASRTTEGGAVVHRLTGDPAPAQAWMFAFRELVRMVDEAVQFDLFHGFFLPAVYPCVRPARTGPQPRPILASIRGSDVAVLLDHPHSRVAVLRGLKSATWITSVNQLYLDRVAEEVDIQGRCSVIRNGVAGFEPTARWQPDGIRRGVVGTVGDFRPVKDIPLLLRGYAGVDPAVRRRLLLAGFFSDAEEQAWTQTLAGELLRPAELELTGRFDRVELERVLRMMHVYVQSSSFEGLPNSVLEAASFGVPIIATAVGGMREVLEHEKTALLVPHGDPARLTSAMAQVLSSDALAATLSAGALALAGELSIEREKRAWLELYRMLLLHAADGSQSIQQSDRGRLG